MTYLHRQGDFLKYIMGVQTSEISRALTPMIRTTFTTTSHWWDFTTATYSKNGEPLLFFSSAIADTNPQHTVTSTIGVLRHLNDLAHDTIVYLSHTTDVVHWYHPGTDSMIAVTGLYTMDITGDGIPDLLVTDGVYIYIFKGSDSLGYYPLTKYRAYYRIPHPVLLEGSGSDWSYIDGWASSMFNCGDLTGSGVPVLGVIGGSSTSGDYDAVFFYCGGKALDSLFDGLLYHNVQFDGGYENLDTLHSIDSTGRSAVLVPLFGGPDLVLNRDGDKMPHRTNSLWLTVQSSKKRQALRCRLIRQLLTATSRFTQYRQHPSLVI